MLGVHCKVEHNLAGEAIVISGSEVEAEAPVEVIPESRQADGADGSALL